MEWRCEWCGKPHEENDPPCDNCGHGKFEQAVVRQTDLAEDGPESTLVWVCTECGRDHTKHSPPCSRCGNVTLEKQQKGVDESELTAPGYLDLVTPRYLAVLTVTLVLATVFVLGFAGIVDVPGFPDDSVPDVSDVPGDEAQLGSAALADAEAAYFDEFNALRVENGNERLDRDERLDEIATFYNQRWVKADYADGTLPSGEELGDLLQDDCSVQPILLDVTHVPDGDSDGRDLGEAVLEEEIVPSGAGLDYPGQSTGIDVHATPDDRLYVTQFIC